MTLATQTSRRVRSAVALLSPARRRWLSFLHSLPLDPDALARPVPQPGPRDFVICGSPRTGTTLLCSALFQPPSVVTVMEPWDGMRLPPAELFASLRQEIDTTGQLRRGRLDLPALQQAGVTRWCRDGEVPVALPRVGEYALGVKWPAYWRYLELLPDTKFLVCLRDPADVIASYERTGGRVRMGLDYDTAFNRRMNEHLRQVRDWASRRVELFDYIHERILPHLERPNVLAVRYERWFDDASGLMAEISDFLGVSAGEPPVAIRPPGSTSDRDHTHADDVRARCRTAVALDYGHVTGRAVERGGRA